MNRCKEYVDVKNIPSLQEKGNCPLHVAAAAAQASQVELLLIYGADPGAYDSNGKTPVDHARYVLFAV